MTNGKIISSNFLVAASSACIFYVINSLYGTPLGWEFVLIVVLLSLAEYFYDRARDITAKKFDRLAIKIFSISVFAALLILLARYQNIRALIFFISVLLLGFFYPIYFKKLTSRIIGFKDVFTPFVWSMVNFFYFAYYDIEITNGLLIFILLIFIRDFINTSYCDLKDINQDSSQKLFTLANFLGPKRLVVLLQWLNLVSVAMIVFSVSISLMPDLALLLIFPIAFISYLINKSKHTSNYSPSYVDIEYILWALLIYLYGIIYL